ncbi:hypothetical protein niasHT_000121 [Heterodera trifolii]|uniref:Uncharacterized protein n=1 Tax=Heterodera trifolii TaxID=157864 RepID=A0ABD2LSI2_9BILA
MIRYFHLAVILLIICRCCHAEEDPPATEPPAADGDGPLNMENFVCAKKDTQHGFITQKDGMIVMDSEGIPPDALLYYFQQKNEGKLNIRMAVEEECKEVFDKDVPFTIDTTNCEKKPNDGGGECPESIPKCKFFDIVCPIKMRAVIDPSDAGVFKAKFPNLANLQKVCKKWQGFVDGAVLVLDDPTDSSGEPCKTGGPPWMIIGISVGAGVALLFIVIVIVCVLRARNKPQQPAATSIFQTLSNWSQFGRQSSAGTKMSVGRSAMGAPGSMMTVSKANGTKTGTTAKSAFGGSKMSVKGSKMDVKGTTLGGSKAMGGTQKLGASASAGAYGIL